MSSGYQCRAVSDAEIAFQVGQPRKNGEDLPLFFYEFSSPRPHHLELGYKWSNPAEATSDGWTLREGCSYPSLWEVEQRLWAIPSLLLWSNGAGRTMDLIYSLGLTIPTADTPSQRSTLQCSSWICKGKITQPLCDKNWWVPSSTSHRVKNTKKLLPFHIFTKLKFNFLEGKSPHLSLSLDQLS